MQILANFATLLNFALKHGYQNQVTLINGLHTSLAYNRELLACMIFFIVSLLLLFVM